MLKSQILDTIKKVKWQIPVIIPNDDDFAEMVTLTYLNDAIAYSLYSDYCTLSVQCSKNVESSVIHCAINFFGKGMEQCREKNLPYLYEFFITRDVKTIIFKYFYSLIHLRDTILIGDEHKINDIIIKMRPGYYEKYTDVTEWFKENGIDLGNFTDEDISLVKMKFRI